LASEREADWALDEGDGSGGDLLQARDECVWDWTRDLPVFIEEQGDHRSRSGVVRGHHLPADAARVHVSDGGDGLVESVRAGLGVEHHAGGGVLCPGLATGPGRGNQPPLIANTDQGAQFTSVDYVGAVQEAGVLVSMDGRGRWMDNRFVERLWRILKYEDIYLRGYEHGLELRQGVGNWFGDYNDYRPHQALGYATPAEVYRAPESHGAKPAIWA